MTFTEIRETLMCLLRSVSYFAGLKPFDTDPNHENIIPDLPEFSIYIIFICVYYLYQFQTFGRGKAA